MNDQDEQAADIAAALREQGSEIERLKAEIGRWKEIKNEEVNIACEIAHKIGIAEEIEAGKSYYDAEVGLFERLRGEIIALEKQLAEVTDHLSWINRNITEVDQVAIINRINQALCAVETKKA